MRIKDILKLTERISKAVEENTQDLWEVESLNIYTNIYTNRIKTGVIVKINLLSRDIESPRSHASIEYKYDTEFVITTRVEDDIPPNLDLVLPIIREILTEE